MGTRGTRTGFDLYIKELSSCREECTITQQLAKSSMMTRVSGGLEGAKGEWENRDLWATLGADSVVKEVRKGSIRPTPGFPGSCSIAVWWWVATELSPAGYP